MEGMDFTVRAKIIAATIRRIRTAAASNRLRNTASPALPVGESER
jgi:hypothetical protein